MIFQRVQGFVVGVTLWASAAGILIWLGADRKNKLGIEQTGGRGR